MPSKRYPDSPLGAASYAFAVTANDGADLAQIPRALYVGTGGNLTVRMADDPATSVLFKNVASGQVLDIQAVRVMATGTTAGDIVGLV